MMTAEQLAQFFHETYERLAPWFGYKTREESAKPWANVPEQNRKLMTAVCAEVLSDAVAQLAEREREIAALSKVFEFSKQQALEIGRAHEQIAGLNRRAEAAEQRLQEAQAEIDRLQDGWTKTVADKHKLIAELGQREAELEQAIALLRDLPLDRFGDDMAEHDAAEFVDNAGYFFDVMFRAKKLLATREDAGRE